MTAPAEPLWVGTYPPDGAGTPSGRGEGAWLLDAADTGGGAVHRVAEVRAASFLAQHPRGGRLYAVSETAPGALSVFRPGRSPWSLDTVTATASGGAFPCHVALDPTGRRLFVAHYGDGVVASFTLDAAGDLDGPPVLLPSEGSRGPDRERQDGPHAHACLVSPDERFLLVADLGTDELRRYRLEAPGPPVPDGVCCRLPPGSGPRHLAFGGGSRAGTRPTLYVTLELSAEIAVLDWDPARGSAELRSREPLAVSAPRARGDDSVAPPPAQPSHLVVDGDRLLVGVRGPDVIATFDILDEGGVTLAGVTPTLAWPRHFDIVGEWLVVAGERSDAVGFHPRRGPAGAVGELRRRVAVAAPACVVAAAGWRA